MIQSELPQMFTNDLLCVYYETCQSKNCPSGTLRLPDACPVAQEAPKCFCLTPMELTLLCAYVNTVQLEKPIKLLSELVPMPIVDSATVERYVPSFLECARKYRTRDGLIVTGSQIEDNDIAYMSGLLLHTYVIYNVIDLDYLAKGDSLDAEWNGTLIKILAGFLYYNAYFAERYFRTIADEFLKKSNTVLLSEIKKIILAIDEWHKVRNKEDKKKRWGVLFKDGFPAYSQIQASVRHHFLTANDYYRLQWNFDDPEPVQWAMKFIKIMMRDNAEDSWLSYCNQIRKIM